MLSKTLADVISFVEMEKGETKNRSTKYLQKYARQIIQRVIWNEPGRGSNLCDLVTPEKKNLKRKGEIKVSLLSNNRAKQSDPRLAQIMYYRIL